MKIADRCCEACAASADPSQTSANFARVVWLCTRCGSAFNAYVALGGLSASMSTDECWRRIDERLAELTTAAPRTH